MSDMNEQEQRLVGFMAEMQEDEALELEAERATTPELGIEGREAWGDRVDPRHAAGVDQRRFPRPGEHRHRDLRRPLLQRRQQHP